MIIPILSSFVCTAAQSLFKAAGELVELQLQFLLGIAAGQTTGTSYVQFHAVGTHACSIRGDAKLESWRGIVSDAYLRLTADMWLTCVSLLLLCHGSFKAESFTWGLASLLLI